MGNGVALSTHMREGKALKRALHKTLCLLKDNQQRNAATFHVLKNLSQTQNLPRMSIVEYHIHGQRGLPFWQLASLRPQQIVVFEFFSESDTMTSPLQFLITTPITTSLDSLNIAPSKLVFYEFSGGGFHFLLTLLCVRGWLYSRLFKFWIQSLV